MANNVLGLHAVAKIERCYRSCYYHDTPLEVDGKNAEAFVELIQFLDDCSLSLIMRDACDNGRKALEILREHYAAKGKPRIISLYTALTSLCKLPLESITNYMIKAENTAAALRNAGETVSDGLLIAMVLKGLPSEYKPFEVVVTQNDTSQTFPKFKVALRNFEETENVRIKNDSSIKTVNVYGKNNKLYMWFYWA